MSRKHNCKHLRGRSNYKHRLADRGLGKTPRMKWTGLSTGQIQAAFDALPRYKWDTYKHVNEETGKVTVQSRRREI